MQSLKINFLFPSTTRPEKFFETLDNLNEMCLSESWEVIAILEESDLSMNNQSVKERLGQYPNIKPFYITSTGKIDAMNKGLNYLSPDYSIMVLIADDIRFTMKGFDMLIQSDMFEFWPKLDGLLHYPDNIPQSGERQITMPVMGKRLIEEWGYIYHPSFVSTWCDNFQLAVAKQTGVHKFIRMYFYDHHHPAFGRGENDDLYRLNEGFYHIDKETFFKHQANNFGL